ncbi:unnamed protein product, partial [marine sediment metagenome]
NKGKWILLCGWDNSDWQWRRLENPWEDTAFYTADYLPLGCLNIVFHGVDVSPDKWNEAVQLFDAEMH